MKRKLALLNVVLVALAALIVWRIWSVHQEMSTRESAVLPGVAETRDVAPPPSAAPPEEIAAIDYIGVAEQYLFSPDRNSNVEIEAAPELPLPTLPIAHGILDIGSGPTAILSMPGEEGQRAYRIGESVGGFVLAGISADELTLQWEGGVVRRSLNDLTPQDEQNVSTAAVRRAPPPPKPAAQEKPKSTVLSNNTNSGPSDIDMGGGMLACRPGDTSPSGTVFNGYRKLVTQTPFGAACRWLPIE